MTDVLSGLDSLFLHLETPRTPMHAASIAVFESGPLSDAGGRVRLAELERRIAHRLDAVPRLRQRVRRFPLGLVPPAWEDDPHFDLAHHVHVTAVPSPGTDRELLALCAELVSWQLDLSRPPWELWFVEGVAGGRVAVLEKFHHAMADGLAGTQLALALLDARPDAPEDEPGGDWRPSPQRHLLRLGAHDVSERAAELARFSGAAAASAVHPTRAWRAVSRAADGLRSALARPALAPRLSVNASVGRHRRLAVVRQDLDELRAVARKEEVTVNDLLLTAVAGGLQALFAKRGQHPGPAHVLVPVGLEHPRPGELGNAVSAMVVRLPVDSDDVELVLAEVAQSTASAKAHHQSWAAQVLVETLEVVPDAAIEAVGRLVQHQPFVNLVVTNVPGPSVPLYALGARMVEAVPLVPIAGNLSVGIAALSYESRLTVGITADRDACPDVDVLAGGMEDTFLALTSP